MAFPQQQQQHGLVYNVRLSSVGPGQATGTDVVHGLSGLDLAMKLHYLKGVYFFSNQAVEGLTLMQMKEPMFYWLNNYYFTNGRIKRTESGRPYIKCNDCGIRFVDAVCDKTVDEWLEMEDHLSLQNLLVYHLPIGPDLSFSPSVYFQVTRFKCGGMSLGISWAHFLGDAFSASDFINDWGPYMANPKLKSPIPLPKSLTKNEKPHDPTQVSNEPLSAKQVNPVGDLWVTANNCKMETFSFSLNTPHLSTLQAKVSGEHGGKRISPFESVCAVIWQCIAKVREGFEPQTVTVCRKGPNHDKNVPSNSQIISAIKADFSVKEADLKKLAFLLADYDDDEGLDERNKIESAVERDDGVTDYIMYGANLTFVNMEDASLYGLELKGLKPKFAYYSIQGVGDEGAVLFLPKGPPSSENEGKGRLVTITLPEDQVLKLKTELKSSGLLLPSELE
ncbi:hypothetical protein PTKIN_Ptkin09bG0238400 [Pterospermum kingtungense]